MPAPILGFSSAAADSLTYSLNNTESSSATILFELNRASDFTSDDSLFYSVSLGAGTTSVTISGLPSGTPWFARASLVLTGATSGTVLAATAAVAATTVYAGYSIDKAALIVPEDVVNLAVTAGTVIAGYPWTNMLSDSPAAAARFGSGTTTFTFETAGVPIDTVALLGTLMSDSATWRVVAHTDAARTAVAFDSTSVTFRCSPTLGRRPVYHGLMQLPTPVTARFWSITMTNLAPVGIVRNLIVGLARKSVNPSRSWSQGLNDLGSAARSRFGDPDRVFGWRGRAVDFEMSWLSEAEYQTKWADLPLSVGKTRSVLVMPNSKRNTWLNDRLALGTITSWQGENVQSSKFSQSITIDSIY